MARTIEDILCDLIEHFRERNWMHLEDFKRITGYDENEVMREVERILAKKKPHHSRDGADEVHSP